MFKPKFTITNLINNSLLEIERARGFLDAANLKEEWIKHMQSKAIILEAHHSTHIEGTQLTLSQAQRILEGKPIKSIKQDDRQELLNHRFSSAVYIPQGNDHFSIKTYRPVTFFRKYISGICSVYGT